MIKSILNTLKEIKKQNLKIGFTCSTFDLLHAGHIAMLADAKNQCDYLVVGLQNDPSIDRAEKNAPIQTLVERQLQLFPVSYVDEIIVYNTEKDLEDLLLLLPIDIRILGVEYENRPFTGKEICLQKNIEIHYNKRDHGFSTTDLRKRVYEAEQERARQQERMLNILKTGTDEQQYDPADEAAKKILMEWNRGKGSVR